MHLLTRKSQRILEGLRAGGLDLSPQSVPLNTLSHMDLEESSHRRGCAHNPDNTCQDTESQFPKDYVHLDLRHRSALCHHAVIPL